MLLVTPPFPSNNFLFPNDNKTQTTTNLKQQQQIMQDPAQGSYDPNAATYQAAPPGAPGGVYVDPNYQAAPMGAPGYPQQQPGGYPQQQPGGYPQQQQPGGPNPAMVQAQREAAAQQGAQARQERDTLATDRATLEHQAKLLKMQEKQKKKEGKKLLKQEKALGKAQQRATKQEAERKVLAGEMLTPEEQRALTAKCSSSSESSGDEKKNKKKSDKRVKEIRKELLDIDLKIDKLLMEKEKLNIAISQATGEPLPGQYAQGGAAPYDPNMPGGYPAGDGARGGAAVQGHAENPQSPRKENFFHRMFHHDKKDEEQEVPKEK